MHRPVYILPGTCSSIALIGGPYSNFAAVERFLAATQHVEHRFCLGDIGGFGPHPDRTLQLIRDHKLICIQGNYDHALGFGERDCGCGYSDPLDRHYAQVSYDYTAAHTSDEHKAWLRELPEQLVLHWQDKKILLCHGSPEQANEFVWESETSDQQIRVWLDKHSVDAIVCTHSGIPWLRRMSKGFWFNVGVLGRPAHEHYNRVYFGMIDFKGDLVPRLLSLEYDPQPVIAAMRAEGLPEVFAQSLATGLWTTCYNVLPTTEATPRDRT